MNGQLNTKRDKMILYECERCEEKVEDVSSFLALESAHLRGDTFERGSYDLCKDCYKEFKEITNNWIESEKGEWIFGFEIGSGT